MNREQFLRDYWAYYLMLEEKFIHTLNYVALAADNEKVYSNEYAGLIQMIGAEMDSFFKAYCGFLSSDNRNISHYYSSVVSDFPDILNQEVKIRMADMTIKPFFGWDGHQPKKSLFWWEAFDNIKHSRASSRKDGCQKNVLYALAALFLLEMKYLQKITCGTNERDIPNEPSHIFSLSNWTFRYIDGRELAFCIQEESVAIGSGNASDHN